MCSKGGGWEVEGYGLRTFEELVLVIRRSRVSDVLGNGWHVNILDFSPVVDPTL